MTQAIIFVWLLLLTALSILTTYNQYITAEGLDLLVRVSNGTQP